MLSSCKSKVLYSPHMKEPFLGNIFELIWHFGFTVSRLFLAEYCYVDQCFKVTLKWRYLLILAVSRMWPKFPVDLSENVYFSFRGGCIRLPKKTNMYIYLGIAPI